MASASEAAEFRRLYTGLVRNPASEIRKEAILKRAELSDAVIKARAGLLLGAQGTYYTEELAAVDQFVRWGDELKSSKNVNNRQERRRLYARAYLRAREAQATLAALARGES